LCFQIVSTIVDARQHEFEENVTAGDELDTQDNAFNVRTPVQIKERSV
jgi:hypothetical protein